MEEKFLYKKIYKYIVDEITSGNLKSGDKILTEFEIMDKFSVSRVTATKALSALSADEYIIRNRRSGSFVAENPPSPLKKRIKVLYKENIRQIALVTPFPSAWGGTSAFSLLLQSAFENKIAINVFVSRYDLQTEREILTTLLKSDIQAVICIPIVSTKNVDCFEALRVKGTPVLFIDWALPFSNIPLVTFTHMSSIKKLTDWLLDNKFSDLAFCFNSEIITSECEMLRGFLSALTERGIYFDQKNLIRLGNSYNTGGTEVDIIKASIIKERLQEYLDNGNLPEVIVCVNDATARMVVDAAKYLGIKIPEQLSVTGFEDNSGIANVLKDSVGLTTVHQDFSQFAKTIIDALLLLLQGKEITKPIMCDTHMVIRESVNLNLKKD